MRQSFEALTDKDLVTHFENTTRHERRLVAESVRLLIEIVRRDLHARLGCPSMFAMLRERCHLSESCASKRASAAAAARAYPEVLDLLEQGTLNISNLALVSRHLNDENKTTFLKAACELTHRALEDFLAQRQGVPAPERTIIKKVCLSDPRPKMAAKQPQQDMPRGNPRELFSRSHQTEPTAPEVGLRIALTLGTEAKNALEELQQRFPGKSVAEILTESLVARARETSPATKAAPPRSKERSQEKTVKSNKVRSRYIPQSIRHAVFQRDQGRCTYVSPDGRRCAASEQLEYDHARPFARGGETTVSGLRLRCRCHNLLAAKDDFGKAFIESHFTS
jgi:5-methylcytosine-specific restriction endonuclease McrA